MKKFLKHFGFAILYVIVLLIIGFAPEAIFDTTELIPFWVVLLYDGFWALWGAMVMQRISKWR